MSDHNHPLRWVFIALFAFILPAAACAETSSASSETILVGGKDIRSYRPVLAETKRRAFPIDPDSGLWIGEIKENLWLVTAGVWQSAFLTTGKGVVVFAAPASYGAKLPAVIQNRSVIARLDNLIASRCYSRPVRITS